MSTTTYLEQVVRGQTQLTIRPVCEKLVVAMEFLLFILDRSWSMEEPCGRLSRLEAAKQAISAMLNARAQMNASDRVAIIAFGSKARLVLRPTHCVKHRQKVDRALKSITFGDGTDFVPPLKLAKRIVTTNESVHIVMLSDGHAPAATRAANALKASGAVIETIGVANKPTDVNEAVLKAIASNVNGTALYRFINDTDDLIKYFETEVANRLSRGDRDDG